MFKKKNKELSVERITDKEEVKMMAMDIYYACVDLSLEQRLEIAKVLTILGYGKINKEDQVLTVPRLLLCTKYISGSQVQVSDFSLHFTTKKNETYQKCPFPNARDA